MSATSSIGASTGGSSDELDVLDDRLGRERGAAGELLAELRGARLGVDQRGDLLRAERRVGERVGRSRRRAGGSSARPAAAWGGDQRLDRVLGEGSSAIVLLRSRSP